MVDIPICGVITYLVLMLYVSMLIQLMISLGGDEHLHQKI
jgi:hypothetical protein